MIGSRAQVENPNEYPFSTVIPALRRDPASSALSKAAGPRRKAGVTKEE